MKKKKILLNFMKVNKGSSFLCKFDVNCSPLWKAKQNMLITHYFLKCKQIFKNFEIHNP